MRDLKRIEITLTLLNKLWLHNAELRFNQLMYNLYQDFSYENASLGKVTEISQSGNESIGYDLFYVEDDDFINFLERKLMQQNNESKQ